MQSVEPASGLGPARLPPEACGQREDAQAGLTHHENKPRARQLERLESKEGERRERARSKDAAAPEEYVHRDQLSAALLGLGAALFRSTLERQPAQKREPW